MDTLDDFIKAWDNVISPSKSIILQSPSREIVSLRVDDFILDTDRDGSDFISFRSQGKWVARLRLDLIEKIEEAD